MPNPETFEGLSRALNVRKRDLVLAAARTLGIDVGDDDQSDLILVGAKRLPLASQDLLVAMSREMQDWMDGKRDGVQDAPEYIETEGSSDGAEVPDNVHHLRTPIWGRAAADKGEPGIDHDQLPDD